MFECGKGRNAPAPGRWTMLGIIWHAWSAMRHDYGPQGCCGED